MDLWVWAMAGREPLKARPKRAAALRLELNFVMHFLEKQNTVF
jgi:hypothetical protein